MFSYNQHERKHLWWAYGENVYGRAVFQLVMKVPNGFVGYKFTQ